jgi:putative membrane protein
VILALVNLVLGTLLGVVSLPLRIITLWLFSFVISLVVVYVADQLVEGITLVGIVPLVVVALAQSVTSFFMKLFR